MAGTMHSLDWLFAIGTLFFLLSAWALGANDVANSYATSVSSKSLTMVQAGVLAVCTEFIGAMALGQNVTDTIRKGVFELGPFENNPGTLILAMVIGEAGAAIWLTGCTKAGFPVSTTQSLIGGLIGVGIGLQLDIKWGWAPSSVGQVIASWFIAPCLGAAFSAILMLSLRVSVLSRKDPLRAALIALPFYYAFTAAVLALFFTMDGGHGIPSLEEQGAGQVIGIILGVFVGIFIISAVFLVPFFRAKFVKEDTRLRFWHIPMGPMLWKDNYALYYPGRSDAELVKDYYATEYKGGDETSSDEESVGKEKGETHTQSKIFTEGDATANDTEQTTVPGEESQRKVDGHRQKDLETVDQLPWIHPKRMWATFKLVTTYGVTRDIIGHQSRGLEAVHARAPVFDNKVEALWSTAQVTSAMIMSIAHGANDMSNAIGPFTTEFMTWKSGVASAKTDTPDWIKAVGGITLGIGFWTYGYHIMRNLGNRITKHSPSRGYCMELGAAITVLLASKYGLPISTTQTVTGAIIGVGFMNWDLKSINWKQLGKIVIGWFLTLPCAGLIAGIITGMAINVPQWGYSG